MTIATTTPNGQRPRLEPRALTHGVLSEWRLVVEVAAAFSLPLPALAAVAGGALLGAFDLGGGELEASPNLIGLDLGYRDANDRPGDEVAVGEPWEVDAPTTLIYLQADAELNPPVSEEPPATDPAEPTEPHTTDPT